MPAPETDRPGKVFVGGLASDIDEAILEKYFSHYGRLNEVIVKRDKNTQQTRGYAFITFDDPYDAEDAIKNMDKKEIHGRQIYVEQAVKPRHEQQQTRQPPRIMSRGGGRSVRGGPRGRGRGSSSLGSRRSPVSMRSERQMGRGPDRVGPPRRSSYEAPPRRDGGDRYGGMDRRMDRGPPPRSRDPPLSRSRDDFTPPREYRGLPDSRMGRNSGRDFQQTSRYDAPMRDYSPPPREYQSSRDMDYDRGPVRGDRMSSRDYGSAPSGRDFNSGPSRGRGGRSSMYTDGPRDRDVYSGGRDRDPSSRDFISSREFSNRSAPRASDFDRVQSRDYDSFREGGRSVQSSRTFSSMDIDD